MKVKRNNFEIFWKVDIKMSQSRGENAISLILRVLSSPSKKQIDFNLTFGTHCISLTYDLLSDEELKNPLLMAIQVNESQADELGHVYSTRERLLYTI